MRHVEPPAPNAFPPPLSNKRCGCLREFLYPALVRPQKLASPFRTAGSDVAMGLRDTLSFRHVTRFRRYSATRVVDADENFYRLRSCAHKTRITLPDRWQRSRNGLTRHVEPAST